MTNNKMKNQEEIEVLKLKLKTQLDKNEELRNKFKKNLETISELKKQIKEKNEAIFELSRFYYVRKIILMLFNYLIYRK